MTDAPPPARIPNIAHRNLPPRDERDWVLSTELVDQPGITYRQLDYWCRTGLLTPREDIHGSGWSRSFDQYQVTRAHLLRTLLDFGWSLQMCREHVDHLLENGSLTLGATTITVHLDRLGAA